MNKIFSAILAAVAICLLTGCGTGDGGIGGAGSATAEAHGVVLPDGIASKFPLPAEATVRTNTEYEKDTRAIFSIPMSYAEGIEYFNAGFESHGWTTEHSASEEARQGGRWDAEGHGVNLTFTLTAPLGESGPLTGTLMVYHPD
ncbi:hypothetical protein IC757_07305 [Wenzhouxiangella sp. AB-CW3]|uniref:hypothetical protein n=1 Tax=Wenzhouxiangella sp. AB-CW3 TaxID=2771012 RepID=UPI00168A8D7F|nr:hypothetical protein [Wenzhouxiangella sp. AB-CW3]QOC23912.1 hypothetical protein IC757_07305 [Wenzhouxiangella sp. AB-CW3]